jgi:hypothetical protein
MSTKPKEEERIYIGQLAEEIHREMGTIRKWEHQGKLPKHLRPRRGERNHRYWTRKQVEGIKAWMKRNDMRPGRVVTDPSKEDQHVEHLRKPKGMDGYAVRDAKKMAAAGKSRAYIVRKLFPRTKYASPENLEAALVRLFRKNGWDFPPPPAPPKTKPKKTKKVRYVRRSGAFKIDVAA